jgi:hypothetical protein
MKNNTINQRKNQLVQNRNTRGGNREQNTDR